MIIGFDKKGQKLELHDICKFTIDNKEHEGMVLYEEEDFAFAFEMLDNQFPCILMNKVDRDSIEKIVNVWETKVNEDKYEPYRKLIKGETREYSLNKVK